ncbi:Putative ribonuclease H protein At1g65750 [Linum perenne]
MTPWGRMPGAGAARVMGSSLFGQPITLLLDLPLLLLVLIGRRCGIGGDQTGTSPGHQGRLTGWLLILMVQSSNLERGCGGGGLVRNSSGHCLLAFTANLGSCSITRAELWGILIGLRLAWNAGYKKIIVQTDSQVAVQLLTDDSSTNHHHGLEVTQFKEFNARS